MINKINFFCIPGTNRPKRILLGIVLFSFSVVCAQNDSEECHQELVATWSREAVSTPGYPIPYANNLNCSWLIRVQRGFQIEFKFSVVDIEPEYDNLKIYDGNDENAPLLSNLHGNVHIRAAIVSSAGFIFLRFASDNSVSERGFKAHYRIALTSELNVTTTIQSCLAQTTITKEVLNRDIEPREVEFKIVFPDEAFITDFEMTVGGVKYSSRVERRQSIRQKYQDIDVQWVSMGYVTSTKDLAKRFFTGIVLQPGKTVKFKIVYQQLLKRRLGRYTNTIILTRDFLLSDLTLDIYICARAKMIFLQVPPIEDAGKMSYIGQVRFLGRKDNFPPNVRVTKEGNVAHIHYQSIRNGALEPISSKRNVFVTHYDVERDSTGTISVFGGEYFATFFSPENPNLVRRIVFVLDVSGSMAGNKIEQVKIAMRNILARLKRKDSFNIVQFESVVRMWKPVGLVTATPEAKRSAEKYIDSFDPEGQTNINEALLTGLRLLSQGVSKVQAGKRIDVNAYRDFVFFLGDGKPTVGVRNPNAISRAVRNANKRGFGINTIGFGKNVDVRFLQRLTRENHGKWRIIYEDDDSHLQIQNFIIELGVPTMTDITFSFDRNQVNFTTKRQDLVLVNGGEVTVFGRLMPNMTDKYINVTVAGRTFKRTTKKYGFRVDQNLTKCDPIKDKLIQEFVERGYGITLLQETLKKLRETTDTEENKKITKELTEISLGFNLVTPVTSLIVQKNQTNDEDEQRTAVETPNEKETDPRKPKPGDLVEKLPGTSSPWVFEGDPHFIVALGNNITICFSWNGTDGQNYNLLHDPISGVTLNGLIRYGPRSSNESNCNATTKKKKSTEAGENDHGCDEEIQSFFVKLGFVFFKERIKIEITPREVLIVDERLPKHAVEELLPASDEKVDVVRGGVGIKVYNITKVHSFVNVTLNGTITFTVNMKRGRNLPVEKKRPGLIDHLDLDVVGHSNLSPDAEGLFGVFPKDVRTDFQKNNRKMRKYPVARLRRVEKHTLLQYRKSPIAVEKRTINDPYSKKPLECWFSYEENLLIGKPDEAFEVKNIFDFPTNHNLDNSLEKLV